MYTNSYNIFLYNILFFWYDFVPSCDSLEFLYKISNWDETQCALCDVLLQAYPDDTFIDQTCLFHFTKNLLNTRSAHDTINLLGCFLHITSTLIPQQRPHLIMYWWAREVWSNCLETDEVDKLWVGLDYDESRNVVAGSRIVAMCRTKGTVSLTVDRDSCIGDAIQESVFGFVSRSLMYIWLNHVMYVLNVLDVL